MLKHLLNLIFELMLILAFFKVFIFDDLQIIFYYKFEYFIISICYCAF